MDIAWGFQKTYYTLLLLKDLHIILATSNFRNLVFSKISLKEKYAKSVKLFVFPLSVIMSTGSALRFELMGSKPHGEMELLKYRQVYYQNT